MTVRLARPPVGSLSVPAPCGRLNLMRPAGRLLRRLITDESGQDIVEYALLGALLGVSGLAAYTVITGNIKTSFTAWDSNVQALWDMPAPGGS